MVIPEENEEYLHKQLLNVGYGSTYTCINYGTFFLFYVFFIVSAMVLALFKPLIRRNKFMLQWHSKLAKPLYWNIFLRLTLEATIEISVAVINNFQMELSMYRNNKSTFYYQRHLPFFWINLVTNVISMLYIVFGIPLLLYFYLRQYNHWGIEVFEAKFGATLDSLRTNKKFSIFYPTFFIFRRVIFAWQGTCLTGNYLITMHTQFYFSLIQMGYIISCQPFTSQLLTYLEILNETTMLLSLYSVFLFNHLFVTDEQFIENVGYFMIAVIVLCMAIHFFFLIRTIVQDFAKTVHKCKLKCKRKTPIRRKTTII